MFCELASHDGDVIFFVEITRSSVNMKKNGSRLLGLDQQPMKPGVAVGFNLDNRVVHVVYASGGRV